MKLGVVLRNSPRLAYIDSVDEHHLASYNRYLHSTGCVFGNTNVMVDGKWVTKNVRLHRLLTEAPKGMEVDHIDGDKLNNCRDNLRLCKHVENNWNKPSPKKTKSGYRGVSWHSRNKLWRCRIKVYTKEVLLGYFKSAEEASAVYESARMFLHEDFLWQN